MTQYDVLAQYRQRLPELFATALGRLEQRAASGDRGATALLSKLAVEPTPVRVQFTGEGGGEFALHAGREGFSFVDPGELRDSEFGFAVTVTAKAARHGLTMIERGELHLDEIAHGVALLGSRTSRELFTRTPFAFEIEIEDVPVLGTVRNAIRMGRSASLATPEFVLRIEYDELADAREQKLPPHQLFLAGKVRIEGDAGKAMLLAMTLAQLIR